MALTVPDLRVKRQMFTLVNAAKSAGPSTTGAEQVIESGGGLWEAQVDFLIDGHDEWLDWDAFVADMRGMFNTANVPYDQWKRAPWPIDSEGRSLTPWFTRRPQFDGGPYEDPLIPAASQITATVGSSALLGATQIPIAIAQGSAVRKGHKFSVLNRLYQVLEIVATVGTTYTCRIEPELRATYSGGTAVVFPSPLCEMRFADNQQGIITDDGLGQAVVSVKFREAL